MSSIIHANLSRRHRLTRRMTSHDSPNSYDSSDDCIITDRFRKLNRPYIVHQSENSGTEYHHLDGPHTFLCDQGKVLVATQAYVPISDWERIPPIPGAASATLIFKSGTHHIIDQYELPHRKGLSFVPCQSDDAVEGFEGGRIENVRIISESLTMVLDPDNCRWLNSATQTCEWTKSFHYTPMTTTLTRKGHITLIEDVDLLTESLQGLNKYALANYLVSRFATHLSLLDLGQPIPVIAEQFTNVLREWIRGDDLNSDVVPIGDGDGGTKTISGSAIHPSNDPPLLCTTNPNLQIPEHETVDHHVEWEERGLTRSLGVSIDNSDVCVTADLVSPHDTTSEGGPRTLEVRFPGMAHVYCTKA
jgi:hypothetical protein